MVFSVLRFWTFFDRFFGFCVKRLRFFGFCVQCGLRIFCFLASGFRFSQKNTSGFSVLVPNVVFGFSYFFFPIWTYLGIQFWLRFSVLADFVFGFAVLDEFFFGFAFSSILQCPPP